MPKNAASPQRFCSSSCGKQGRERPSVEDRFWPQVRKDGPIVRPELGPCSVWTGSTNPGGYGVFSIGHHHYLVHRLVYSWTYGPIPDGLAICHRCDNPPCVRDEHLFPGTLADNNADMRMKGRNSAPRGERSPSAKLTEESVRAIRDAHAAGALFYELAQVYGVSAPTISAVVNRTWWKHVP
jgi:hypothetical protein